MMKFDDRIAHRVQATRGSVRKFLGKATGDSRLEAVGRRERTRGNVKRAADKLRDAFKR
ncbi:CsbD family protein [Nocardia sp. NPDC023852]|uniref:CsbD family protein n=1 Tax=Nocardia sp. NPDC023852 TaxID=3154697 RepID=UPI0033CD7903